MTFLLYRVAVLLFRPGSTWAEIKDERTSTVKLLFGYVAVLAATAIVERVVLTAYRYSYIEAGQQVLRRAVWQTLWENIPFAFVDLLNLYIVGRIANSLMPPPEDDPVRGLRIAAYASTPLWVARLVVPFDLAFTGPLALLAVLDAPYLLYRGIAVVLDLPARQALRKTVALVLAAAFVAGIVDYLVYLFVVL
jgi:hypothetical protein